MTTIDETYTLLTNIIESSVNNMNPTRVFIAEVIKLKPIELKILNTDITIYSSQILLTKNVMNYKVNITNNQDTTEIESHTHNYVNPSGTPTPTTSENRHKHTLKGKTEHILHHTLSLRDNVVVLQFQGANKYLILDKVYEGSKYESVNNL